MAWGQTHGMGDAPTIEAVATAIAALPFSGFGARTVVITQGSAQTVIAGGGFSGIKCVPVPPVANIVDSNGAGDAFVGGFLAALAAGKDVEACAAVGTWAAGIIIQRSGCTFDSSIKCPLL